MIIHCVHPFNPLTDRDGGWSVWTEWSACSATCLGTRTRDHTCTNPTPIGHGRACIEDSVKDRVESCGAETCPCKFCCIPMQFQVTSGV